MSISKKTITKTQPIFSDFKAGEVFMLKNVPYMVINSNGYASSGIPTNCGLAVNLESGRIDAFYNTEEVNYCIYEFYYE